MSNKLFAAFREASESHDGYLGLDRGGGLGERDEQYLYDVIAANVPQSYGYIQRAVLRRVLCGVHKHS